MTVGRAREAIGGPRWQREEPRREAALFASRSSIIQSCKQLPPSPPHRNHGCRIATRRAARGYRAGYSGAVMAHKLGKCDRC